MMNKKLLSIIVLGLTLAGCGSKYKVCPLKYVKRTEADFAEEKNDVEVRLQKIAHNKISSFVGGARVDSRLQGLLLTVKNSSLDKKIVFDNKNIELPLLSEKELSNAFSKISLKGIVLGIGGAALLVSTSWVAGMCLFGAVVSGAAFSGLASFALTSVSLGALCGAPIVLGVGVKDTYDAHTFNVYLKKDLSKKLPQQFTVLPNKKNSFLLFVWKKDLPESFEMTVLKGEEKVPFTINLNK